MKKRIAALMMALMMFAASLALGETVSGRFTGTAEGFAGEISVTITLKKGKITNVIAVGPQEILGAQAVGTMASAILASGSLDVDTVASATLTSRGVLRAAENALRAAGLDPADFSAAAGSAAGVSGYFTASAQGFGGPVTVTLLLENGEIAGIGAAGREEVLGAQAVDTVANAILISRSLAVDTVASATLTSNAVIQASENALRAAGLDPADYYTARSRGNTATANTTTASAATASTITADTSVYNGKVLLACDYTGTCPLTINADGDSNVYVYLDYLSPSFKSVTSRELKSDAFSPYEEDVAFYLERGKSATVDVPVGVYKLYYATGDTFYGTEWLFGDETHYYSSDDELEFYADSDYYHGGTITLSPVLNGNFDTKTIKENDFPGK